MAHKRFHHLTYTDRLKIEKMRAGGASIQEIADALRVHYTTVYRELRRKGASYTHMTSELTTETRYSADKAQEQYEIGQHAKGRPIKLGNDYDLARYIEDKIAVERRSPGAVIMDMKLEGREFSCSVCEKTIYNWIDAGVFLRVTNKELPRGKRKHRAYRRVRPARVPKGLSIEQRPEEINTRQELFHWEMDSVMGRRSGKRCLLVMTERVTRHEIVLPMQSCTTAQVVAQLDLLERRYGDKFRDVFRTITVDNGREFQDLEGMERSVNGGRRTRIYYCHPYSSYERGSNENQNGMLRRIIPKGTDLDRVPDEEIHAAETWINRYPRKILGGSTAERAFREALATM